MGNLLHTSSLALLLLSGACGPGDLADHIEQAGPVAGPFAVSRFFAASGFMGDGMEPGHLTADVNESCKPRPDGARGNCYRFSYLPGPEKWAGVYWQHPANNWGSQPGRAIATSFSRARFFVAAEHDLVLPKERGVGQACDATEPCRTGLACQEGSCAFAYSEPEGARCLASGECTDGQCGAQRCVPAGAGELGSPCGSGADELCRPGLRCGVVDDTFACVPDGTKDVGASCVSRNDCFAGLYCRDGQCAPKTRLGPFNFQVGGIAPTKAGLTYSDEIGVSYFALGERPQPLAGPDWQEFSIDLDQVGGFSVLIGAFMWAVPFPDIDEVSVSGPQPYLADPAKPVRIYVDDIVFE